MIAYAVLGRSNKLSQLDINGFAGSRTFNWLIYFEKTTP